MATPHNACKLTREQVRTIMQSRRPHHYWAKKYGVDRSTIYTVRARHTYRHHTDDLPDWPGSDLKYYLDGFARVSGPTHVQARLTEVQVHVIRATAGEVPATVFAKGLGVSPWTVRNARRGKTYKDVS